MWSRITSIEKKLQAEVTVYSLDGHSLGIKEKIQVRIGDKLEGIEQGIDKLIKLLVGIYLKEKCQRHGSCITHSKKLKEIRMRRYWHFFLILT